MQGSLPHFPDGAPHGQRTADSPAVRHQAPDLQGAGAGLSDLCRGQRPPARRHGRPGADRRHHRHDQRHGHRGARDRARCRNAAARRQFRRRPRGRRHRRRGSRGHAVRARRRGRPHHRPGAHVHARDGHGRAADARGRNRDCKTHRGRPEPDAVLAGQLPVVDPDAARGLRAAQGGQEAPGRDRGRFPRCRGAGRGGAGRRRRGG